MSDINKIVTDPAAEIWNTLSRVNVNEHTEEKMGLTYLSWAWAWGVMMEHYPHLQVEWAMSADEKGVIRDAIYYPGGTAAVQCRIMINGVIREMWLPVMDNRNKSIVNPDSRAISDAKMRCLVKCFALFGLGHYIYAGEDLPADAPDIEGMAERIKDLGVRIKDENVNISDALKRNAKKALESKDFAAMTLVVKALEEAIANAPDNAPEGKE